MPSPQRLTNINRQNQQGRAVAYKSDQHGKIDDVFQFILSDNILQKAGEKGASAKCDNRQIRPDPQSKSVRVIHVRLVKAFEPAKQHGKNTP